MIEKEKSPTLLPWLFLLSAIFIIWQLLVTYTLCSACSIADILLHSHMTLPWRMLPAELWFITAQLLLYVLLTLGIWALARAFGSMLHWHWKKTRRFAFVLWGIVVATILLANQVYYPLSLFAKLSQALLPSILFARFALRFLVALLSITLLTSIAYHIYTRKHWFRMLGIVCLLLAVTIAIHYTNAHTQSVTPIHKQPNIIIIGVDAVRPDHIQYYGNHRTYTPNLDHFLQHSTHFSSAITPLARTFAAWSGILTGQYPPHNKVRFNLMDQRHLKLNHTLAAILQRNGYRTIYATDDRRFSNITLNFGFDKLMGIQAGANDFILGSFNDFPLSNLIVNSQLGAFLFPYSYNNRAAYITYRPKQFIRTLHYQLNRIPRTKPLFLAVHLCLPHWPYIWSSTHEKDQKNIAFLYQLAVNRVDRQFGQFMHILAQEHLLDHSIVVLVSDHGEALGIPGDRLLSRAGYIPGKRSMPSDTLFSALNAVHSNKALNISAGHGTDVLSWSQYNTLLAFRLYHTAHSNTCKQIQSNVSLTDIKPTILSLLHLSAPDTDGQSLAPYILGTASTPIPQPILAETGFTPLAMRSTDISVQNAIYQSIHFFRVDPKTTHVVLQDQAAQELLQTKQRAVYYEQWVLAIYPHNAKTSIYVLLNRATKQWTDDLSSPLAHQAPITTMMKTLTNYYASELVPGTNLTYNPPHA